MITGIQSPDTPANPSLHDIIGNADSYKALMWGSLLAMLSAGALTMAQNIMDLEDKPLIESREPRQRELVDLERVAELFDVGGELDQLSVGVRR